MKGLAYKLTSHSTSNISGSIPVCNWSVPLVEMGNKGHWILIRASYSLISLHSVCKKL